jgi:uncharacterized caspase-like protein
MTTLSRYWLFAVAATLSVAVASPSFAEKRVALVVGNSAYQNTQMLANPVNDAEDMAAALKAVGFNVIMERNLTKRGMESAIARFARLAEDADTTLVFYAGHGIQHRGQNYLMPVDAKLEDEFSLSFELNKIDDMMVGLDRARGVKILILDACRNNPLAERLSRSATSRDFSLNRGLAKIEPTRGMVIAYSTQPNQVALEGSGRNSPFARALVKEIDEPGLEIGTLFRRVARAVNAETDGKQLPELSVSLIGDFYLNTRETDLQAWARTRVSSSSDAYKDFIRAYPKSVFATDARQHLEAIERAERERAQREQAAKLEADRQRLAEEQAARDKIQREAAARADAERARLAREQAEREQQAKFEEERQRLTREQAARVEVAVDTPANIQTAMVTPPAGSAPVPSATVAALSGGALVREIKKELKRVGCYSGILDEIWATADTKLSVQQFVKYARLTTAPVEPLPELLDVLRGRSERVCPPVCKSGFDLSGEGICVRRGKKVAPAAVDKSTRTAKQADAEYDPGDRSRRITKGGQVTCGGKGCQTVPKGCHAVRGMGGGGLGGKIICP